VSLIVSISGVRGVVGESLTPDVVVQYASAFAEYCGKGRIVLGRDGRAAGKILANIASSTLLAMGCDVTAIGVCPTPTVQLAVEHSDAVGGIAVTASHNPMQWNGMKFIGSHGMFLDAQENRMFWDFAAKQTRQYARWEKIGTHTADESFLQKHIDMVLGLPHIKTDVIQKRKFKIVVDCINAAGGVMVPKLLRQLGCSVIEMNCDVSGIFSRNPEPLPENLGELCQRVRSEKADLGIAVDPDVDRLVLITEKGEPFGEEYTVVSVVKFILEKAKEGQKTVVVNLSTTRAVDDVAKQYHAQVVRTPVGEINVAKKMKELGAIVGGEGSGGVILPAVHYGRDAIVGIGLILQMLAESGGTLSKFKSTLPQYVVVKNTLKVGTDSDAALRAVQDRIGGNGSLNTDDGLKIDFSDSWVHLRKSNTEPIIRIIAEAPTRQQAESLVKQFQQQISLLTS
jgi:phosphomannomutase